MAHVLSLQKLPSIGGEFEVFWIGYLEIFKPGEFVWREPDMARIRRIARQSSNAADEPLWGGDSRRLAARRGHVRNLVARLLRENKGQDIIEYALLAALISAPLGSRPLFFVLERSTASLAQGERQLDGDEHGDRLAETGTGNEPPLLRGLDRLVVESEVPIERPVDPHVTDRAIREDDDLEPDSPLNLGTHRFGRVSGLDLPYWPRRLDPIARSVDTAARPATLTGT